MLITNIQTDSQRPMPKNVIFGFREPQSMFEMSGKNNNFSCENMHYKYQFKKILERMHTLKKNKNGYNTKQ